jgi:hypothetical protein
MPSLLRICDDPDVHRRLVVIATLSSSALAAPPPISIKVQNGSLYDVSRQLSEASGCRVTAFGNATVDLDITNATLWDVLAKLEVDYGIATRFRRAGQQIVLEPKGRPSMPSFDIFPSNPTWTKNWRSANGWASALLPGQGATKRAQLALVGHESFTVEKVVIERAAMGAKAIKVTAGVPVSAGVCEPAVIELDLETDAKKLSLRGHVVIKQAKRIEKKVQVPLDDSVVDLAEGRLRIHIASRPSNGQREIHIGWDGMGESVKVDVQLVDEQGAPIRTNGRGSGYSSSGQGHEKFTLTPSGKLFVILKLPSKTTTEEKIPFRFDNESLAPPATP